LGGDAAVRRSRLGHVGLALFATIVPVVAFSSLVHRISVSSPAATLSTLELVV
jgi:hypothetical protein